MVPKDKEKREEQHEHTTRGDWQLKTCTAQVMAATVEDAAQAVPHQLADAARGLLHFTHKHHYKAHPDTFVRLG